jgi:hypothetical protein
MAQAYNATNGRWVYGSQSVDDSNEGFDITIQESDGEGEYWFMAAWPEGVVGCDGATHEGMAWALAWWT